eukprot:CAMPEP_0116897992 /NCGR_PEP_ID=MMETSP0467-20121206/6809_1 /TAXON_ID=283647 /ORGANISM="Mesodinium pulex, Strain SPMC105" /LENGTH=55 /DNA_ID=CAMNT_0004569863 /DNA_START=619 /DNA_END=786 /DNA_ORIENTATION=-
MNDFKEFYEFKSVETDSELQTLIKKMYITKEQSRIEENGFYPHDEFNMEFIQDCE